MQSGHRFNKGFTLIELMIVVVVIAIFLTLFLNSRDSSVTFGINGTTEERCIAGYVHVIGQDGGARQLIGENGNGVRCK